MVTTQDLMGKVDIGRIAKEGKRIYEQVKDQYDPQHKGRFLAIDIDSRNVYLADTSAEALVSAREHHPEKVFYVVKIGYDSAQMVIRSFLESRR